MIQLLLFPELLPEWDTAFCDECGVRHCPDCKTEFTFDELSDAAKPKAREKYLTRGFQYHDDWWENVYELAQSCAEILGITISANKRRSNIFFSGFSNQGDGACFEGSYSFAPNAIAEIGKKSNDPKLLDIAQKLTTMQLTQRLLGRAPFGARITLDGRYSHSGTMACDIYDPDEGEEDGSVGPDADQFTQLMRDFANWIYKQLEAEHDYLSSDEYIDEQLSCNKTMFDEFGTEI